MIRIFRYRAYPNKDQNYTFQQWFGCMRFVYNHGLEKKQDSYNKAKDAGEEKPKSVSIGDISKEITRMKNTPEYHWLSKPPADSIGYELRNLDAAFKNFFRRLKNGENPGFPKFKSKYTSKKAFKFRRTTVNEEAGYISVPKTENVTVVFHRPIQGEHFELARTMIQEPSGKYYVSIMADDGKPPPELPECNYNRLVGIDHGVVNTLTLSDGTVFNRDLYYKRMHRRLDLLHKRLSRKKKGSNNRNKARIRLARQYEKIRHKRKWDVENTVIDLIMFLRENGYSGAVIRKYDIQEMLKRIEPVEGENGYEHNGREVQRMLNRDMASAGMGMMFAQIKEKLPENGLHVFEIPASDTLTTGKCSYCKTEGDLFSVSLKTRKTHCNQCGNSYDMDINAAKNTVEWFLDEKLELVEA